jgi:hypothetical protein
MFNTPYKCCQLWWPGSCIHMHVCLYKWVWMRNHVHAGNSWRLPNLECKTDISVSISPSVLNHCTSVFQYVTYQMYSITFFLLHSM